jgi:hypothetical protein
MKLKLYQDNASLLAGFGYSANRLEYFTPANGSHSWYHGTTAFMSTLAGRTGFGTGALTPLSVVDNTGSEGHAYDVVTAPSVSLGDNSAYVAFTQASAQQITLPASVNRRVYKLTNRSGFAKQLLGTSVFDSRNTVVASLPSYATYTVIGTTDAARWELLDVSYSYPSNSVFTTAASSNVPIGTETVIVNPSGAITLALPSTGDMTGKKIDIVRSSSASTGQITVATSGGSLQNNLGAAVASFVIPAGIANRYGWVSDGASWIVYKTQ